MSYGYPPQSGVQYGYGYATPQPPTRPKPSPGVGITGFVLSFLACVGHVVLVMFSADWYRHATSLDDFSSDTEALAYQLLGAIIGQCAFGLLNLVGIILNIVALAAGRGRVFGLIGLLIGILVPCAAFIWFGSLTGILE